MSDLADIIREQGASVDSLAGVFGAELRRITRTAEAQVVSEFQRDLVIEGGQVQNTPANQSKLRGLGNRFNAALEDAGYGRLVDAFVEQFPGQITYFQDIIKIIGAGLENPLPEIKFGAADMRAFGSQQVSSIDALGEVVSGAGEAARRLVLFSVAGLPFRDLVAVIGQQMEKTVGQATGLAATAIAAFYRTISDRGYRIIERERPGLSLRYSYEGPRDKFTRQFCARLLATGRSYTREEIARMSNGQIPNVLISGGGFNCRHQWVIALDKAPSAVAGARSVLGAIIQQQGTPAVVMQHG